MFNILKKHKMIIIVALVDFFLFWLLFYSGIILPFINLSIESYKNSGTSFPRDTHQKILWICLQFPIIIYIFSRILKYVFKYNKI